MQTKKDIKTKRRVLEEAAEAPMVSRRKRNKRKQSFEKSSAAENAASVATSGGFSDGNGEELSMENRAADQVQTFGTKTVSRTLSVPDKVLRQNQKRMPDGGDSHRAGRRHQKGNALKSPQGISAQKENPVLRTQAANARQSLLKKSKTKGLKATAAALKRKLESKALLPLLAGSGGMVLVAILICLLVGVAGSGFGLLLADREGEQTIAGIVQTMETEYTEAIETIRRENPHDTVEITGNRTDFKTLFALYGAMHSGEDLVSVDANREAEIRALFWKLNPVTHSLRKQTETRFTETVLPNGDIREEPHPVSVVCLKIETKAQTPEEMKKEFLKTKQQRDLFDELQSGSFDGPWGAVLYGLDEKQPTMAAVAEREVGNVGGQPYWSWYGFSKRVDWCACFVSYCADECGYLDKGLCPKFAGCRGGQTWFSEHGKWVEPREDIQPGMVIFYDFEEDGKRDNLADHVGIVTGADERLVHTIEGNWDDRCVRRTLSRENPDILGYGKIA